MARYFRDEEYETLEMDIWRRELLQSDSSDGARSVLDERILRSSSRRCRVQGLLHGLALTVAARLARTVTLSSPDSERAVRLRPDGNGLCGTVGPMSPGKDEHSVKGTAALSLVYATWFGGSAPGPGLELRLRCGGHHLWRGKLLERRTSARSRHLFVPLAQRVASRK